MALLNAFLCIVVLANCRSQFADKTHLEKHLRSHLSHPRNSEAEKLPIAAWINQTFSEFQLLVVRQELFSYTKHKGANIIGILRGSLYGTSKDVITVVGAHYDTVKGSPGVNDNGSGISVMLETARIMSGWASVCQPQYSTVFVAFDFEEIGFFGSSIFVHEWLDLYLTKSPKSQFNGAFILDTIMNFDRSTDSQLISDVILQHFPEFLSLIDHHRYSGSFLQAVQRNPVELDLFQSFNKAFQISSKLHSDLKAWLLPLTIPNSNLNSAKGRWDYMPFIRSDHRSFWFNQNNISLPTIYLSDSVQHRGIMTKCYHHYCDNQELITDDNLDFLLAFYPTLGYNVVLNKIFTTSWPWYSRIDETTILGALPFKSQITELIETEKVGGVVCLVQSHEIDHQWAAKNSDWLQSGVESYWLPVPDFIYAPPIEQILPAIDFIRKFEGSGRSVYIHCKAGRTRSATVLGCYLMQKYNFGAQQAVDYMTERRPQVILRSAHWTALNQYESALKGQS